MEITFSIDEPTMVMLEEALSPIHEPSSGSIREYATAFIQKAVEAAIQGVVMDHDARTRQQEVLQRVKEIRVTKRPDVPGQGA